VTGNYEAIKRYKERHPERYRAMKAAAYKRWREKNKERHAERNREWYRNNLDRVQNTVLKQKFGITKVEYYTLVANQNGVCAIFKRECKSGRNLAVDHCHSTGKIRGLLCTKCNTAIGSLEESEVLFLSALEYLKR